MNLLGNKKNNIQEHKEEKTKSVFNFVDYKINREEQKKSVESLDNKHTRRYIGKIFKDPNKRNKSFYSYEFIEGSLRYLLEKSKPGDTITIQIGPELSEICNGKNDVKEAMDKNEEKKYIQSIFELLQKKMNKKDIMLHITSFEEEHPDFFAKIRQGLIKEVIIPQQPDLIKKDIKIEDIASYLMRAMSVCPDFKKIVQNTKVEGVQKTEKNQPEYYGFIEVVSRLYEFLHEAITNQGGGERQRKYDNIIRILIQGSYPEIKIFSDFIQIYIGDKQFSSHYLRKDEYIKIKKLEEHKELKRKEKMRRIGRNALITGIALSAAIGGIGGYQLSEYKKEKEKQERNEKVIKEKLKEKEFYFYGLIESYKKGENIKEKEKYLESVTQSLWRLFKEVYGEGDNPEAVKAIIANTLLENNEYGQSKLGGLRHLPIDYSIIQEKNLLIEKIIPENEIALARLGYNTIPYNEFLLYKYSFKNTLKREGEIIISLKNGGEDNENTSPKVLIGSKILIPSTGYLNYIKHKKIGYYYDYSTYNRYNFIKVRDINGQELILANNEIPGRNNKSSNKYSLSHAKEGIQKLQKIRGKYQK